VEEVVASIWSEVLNLENVGIHDNFFELGGHSLKATRVNSRLCTIFKIDLALRLLFEHPTVESLARAVVANETRPGQTERIARLHQELRNMSPDRVQLLLQQKRQQRSAQ
jgi:acyl carrier protein